MAARAGRIGRGVDAVGWLAPCPRSPPADFQEVPGVGAVVAASIAGYFGAPESAAVLLDLVDAGVVAEPPARRVRSGEWHADRPARRQDRRRHGLALGLRPGRGRGGDPRRRRARRRLRLEEHLLCRGRRSGRNSKLAKAQQLGIPVLDEDAFRRLLAAEER